MSESGSADYLMLAVSEHRKGVTEHKFMGGRLFCLLGGDDIIKGVPDLKIVILHKTVANHGDHGVGLPVGKPSPEFFAEGGEQGNIKRIGI